MLKRERRSRCYGSIQGLEPCGGGSTPPLLTLITKLIIMSTKNNDDLLEGRGLTGPVEPAPFVCERCGHDRYILSSYEIEGGETTISRACLNCHYDPVYDKHMGIEKQKNSIEINVGLMHRDRLVELLRETASLIASYYDEGSLPGIK
jgi:hypothetical protein